MSCRPDSSHSCFGRRLHSLGDLLGRLRGFLGIGGGLLRALDSFPALLNALGCIGLGLGRRLPALDDPISSRFRGCAFSGGSCSVLRRTGNLVFDTGHFPAFLDLLAGEPCHFSTPIMRRFYALLGRGFRAGQHLLPAPCCSPAHEPHIGRRSTLRLPPEFLPGCVHPKAMHKAIHQDQQSFSSTNVITNNA